MSTDSVTQELYAAANDNHRASIAGVSLKVTAEQCCEKGSNLKNKVVIITGPSFSLCCDSSVDLINCIALGYRGWIWIRNGLRSSSSFIWVNYNSPGVPVTAEDGQT